MHFSVIFAILIFYLPVPANSEYFYYHCNSFNGNYTTNSTYQSNLNQLFSALRSNSTATSFAAGTAGTAPDQVKGIAMCRGDLSASACSSCLSGTLDVLNLCPYYKTALMWYNSCYMYFSNRYFLNSSKNSPRLPLISIYNVTDDPTRFDKAVLQLMSEMITWAVNNSTNFFATGIAKNFSTEYPTIYGLVQCTPDLNKSQCQDCLEEQISYIREYATGRSGARAIGIHCNVRYESDTFYNGPAMVEIDGTLKDTGTGSTKKVITGTGSKKKVIAFAITVPVAAAMLSLAVFCLCLYYKKKSNGRKELGGSEIEKRTDKSAERTSISEI